MKHFLLIFCCCFLAEVTIAQTKETTANGIIRGKVTHALTNEFLSGVSISLEGSNQATKTDSLGGYTFTDLKPGLYNIQFSFVGFKHKTAFEILVNNANATIIDVALEVEGKEISEVKVYASTFIKPVESPVSVQTIGSNEIKRNPGGNRDISKAIQSLPGVGSSTSFRNDLIVRGGAPNENRFYIDGIEIPNINHFVTQGSSGGPPFGLINVDFIKEVNFYSGAFPASRGNMLSSLLDFKLKDGRNDKFTKSITLGSSDFAAALEGPLSIKTTLIASYRYSYLQGLFKWLGLPFLPSYQDAQFKIKTKFNAKNELTILGLGALDHAKLNIGADQEQLLSTYRLVDITTNDQSSYMIGLNYKHYRSKGYSTFVLSRNYLNNQAAKYLNDDANQAQTLSYSSQEIEHKLRFENNSQEGDYKINYGASIEAAHYQTNTNDRRTSIPSIYSSGIDFFKYALFGQLSKYFFANTFNVSIGIRADANSYSQKMNDLFKTISPRLSASYNVNDRLSINFNTGIYYQLPAYTVLGYKQTPDGPLVNQDVDYMRSKHIILGLGYLMPGNTRFTVEGFYKLYDRALIVSTLGGDIPLANLGTDFNISGNASVSGVTIGRSYGIEFMAQKRLKKGFYGIASLTLFRSEFQDKQLQYIQSSWNNQYILNLTGGKVFGKNWEFGAKFRVSGGAPFTPYNLTASAVKANYAAYPRGVLDFDQLNQSRLGSFYQIDLRIDKKFPFRTSSLNLYVDVQNATGYKYKLEPSVVRLLDSTGNPQTDPNDPNKYLMKYVDNISGNVIPTLGAIFEF